MRCRMLCIRKFVLKFVSIRRLEPFKPAPHFVYPIIRPVSCPCDLYAGHPLPASSDVQPIHDGNSIPCKNEWLEIFREISGPSWKWQLIYLRIPSQVRYTCEANMGKAHQLEFLRDIAGSNFVNRLCRDKETKVQAP